MEKKNLITLVMSVIGGLLFALGMVMCLQSEFGDFNVGIMLGVIGAVVLIAMILIRRKMEGKQPVNITGKLITTIAVAVVGTVVFGLGMCMVMVWSQMLWGTVVGIAGIAILLCLIPLIKGVK